MCMARLKLVLMKTCRFFPGVLFSSKSLSYTGGRFLRNCSREMVFRWMLCLFHTEVNVTKAFWAFPILALISSSVLHVLLTLPSLICTPSVACHSTWTHWLLPGLNFLTLTTSLVYVCLLLVIFMFPFECGCMCGSGNQYSLHTQGLHVCL